MARLINPDYMSFPFEITETGCAVSQRNHHIREQIEQVLYTNPAERLFRPEFGAGVRSLIFEPNNSVLWEVTKKRLISALSETLQGEVDPGTLEVSVSGEDEKLMIIISYTLATINQNERQAFLVSS